MALVMINLNGFKQINEALGFHVGDQLLLQVSVRLKEILSLGDNAARIDADEFVLLLKGEQERSTLNQRLDQLLPLLKQSYEIAASGELDTNNSISISASIGIAFFPIDGNNLNDLLRSAELALNSSEDRNESNYLYFDPAQQAAVEHRTDWPNQQDRLTSTRGGLSSRSGLAQGWHGHICVCECFDKTDPHRLNPTCRATNFGALQTPPQRTRHRDH